MNELDRSELYRAVQGYADKVGLDRDLFCRTKGMTLGQMVAVRPMLRLEHFHQIIDGVVRLQNLPPVDWKALHGKNQKRTPIHLLRADQITGPVWLGEDLGGPE